MKPFQAASAVLPTLWSSAATASAVNPVGKAVKTHEEVMCTAPQEVSKVFLGASAVLSNGTVISRAGSAAVAMSAAACERPVLICCETYKFHERVQLDSVTSNELRDPGELAHVPFRPEVTALQDWQSLPRLGELCPCGGISDAQLMTSPRMALFQSVAAMPW
jgi:translation initiation factor 2B subunit (eIF-2B alpha/beta/delta family)